MAELLLYCDNEDLIKEIIMEISKSLAKNDTTHETTGVKNIAGFLETISERAAKTLLSQLPSVTQLLDCEAYQLRNTAVAIMANIVAHAFAGHEEVEDVDTRVRYEEQRMRIVKLLMTRGRDKNSFARSKALTVMSELVERNLINQTLHLDFLQIACTRIKDVASNVRRKAMQLLWKEITVFSKVILKEDTFLSLAEVQAAVEANKKQLEAIEKQLIDKKPKEESKDADDLHEEKQKCISTNEFYELYEKFLVEVENAVPYLIQLLGSKNGSDIVESIKVLTALYKRKVHSALVSRPLSHIDWNQKDDSSGDGARERQQGAEHKEGGARLLHADLLHQRHFLRGQSTLPHHVHSSHV